MVKVLVTGSKGQLGYEVIRELNKQDVLTVGVDKEEMDFLDKEQIKNTIYSEKPDVIVHCGAYTAVDKAEDEADICTKINFEATKTIAQVSSEIKAKLIYVSTDYVFDGTKEELYTVDDKPNPLGVYGKTKLMGEESVKESLSSYFIVRTSWVFGINGNNFVKTMLNLSKTKCELKVVGDQIGSPTYAKDLAFLLCKMIFSDKYGVYHGHNEGFCSWADFAKAIFKKTNREVSVEAIKTEQFGAKAKRPKTSRLDSNNLISANFDKLPVWEDALDRFLEEFLDN